MKNKHTFPASIIKKMKNTLKFGFLTLALSLSIAACNSEKKATSNDTTMVDTTNVDTMVKDSTIKDTTVKVTTEKTEIKKN